MSQVAVFLVESYQGSYVPVVAHLVRIDEVEDCMLEPMAYSMPHVKLAQAQAFIREVSAMPHVIVYDTPIKMTPVGLKWLSEVERAQKENK